MVDEELRKELRTAAAIGLEELQKTLDQKFERIKVDLKDNDKASKVFSDKLNTIEAEILKTKQFFGIDQLSDIERAAVVPMIRNFLMERGMNRRRDDIWRKRVFIGGIVIAFFALVPPYVLLIIKLVGH